MNPELDPDEYYEVHDNIIILDVFSGRELYTDNITDILNDDDDVGYGEKKLIL
jgi:hypothetical protein